ncbi:unnamed protein product [Chironomus riparius]|uniref:Uncharacterized protein n=1 Tax=Chironomus riparius TaxID=315576 RepID=A0A9N9RPV0_9DIPT|nr:unnamed protein product [Chironomus riparius]
MEKEMNQIRRYRLKRDYADLMWPVCAIEEIKTNDDGIMKSLSIEINVM